MADFNITATISGNGAMSPSSPIVVAEGNNQLVTFIPDAGWAITDIVIDNFSLGAITTHLFEDVTSDYDIEITFTEIPGTNHTIAVQDNIAGLIIPGGNVIVADGANQIFSATPSFGYEQTEWIIDDVPEPFAGNFEFINVTTDHTIGATFVKTHVYCPTIRLIADNNKNGQITIKRRNFKLGSYSEGYRNQGPEFQIFLVDANWQPGQTQSGMLQAVGEQVDQLQDYDHIDKSWKVFTVDRIDVKDILIIEGEDYEVLDVDDWSSYNLNSINYRSMVRQIKSRT